MRRRRPREACRSSFAVWLDAINCTDPDWLSFAGPARYSTAGDVVGLWRSWPRHNEYVLWWAR